MKSDTLPEAQEVFNRMMREKTPEERLRMASSMFDTCRELMKAGIRAQNKGYTEKQINTIVFKRLYSQDLSPEMIEKVIEHNDNLEPVTTENQNLE